MKKLVIAFSMIASLMFISCSKDDVKTEEPEVFEVTIGVKNAITTEVADFTKSGNLSVVTGLDVWSCPEGGDIYTPYAYGFFDTNENISVSLLKGYKYKFTARSGDFNIAHECFRVTIPPSTTTPPISAGDVDNKFYYENRCCSSHYGDYSPCDFYYGETLDYVPTNNGSVSIDMVLVSFGLRVSVDNLSEGYVTTSFQMGAGHIDDIVISGQETTFYSSYVMNGFGSSYSDPDYYEPVTVSATWTDSNNTTVPLGSSVINFQRNKIFKININASAPTSDSIFSLTYDNSQMVDEESDSVYFGGDAIDTPVESN